MATSHICCVKPFRHFQLLHAVIYLSQKSCKLQASYLWSYALMHWITSAYLVLGDKIEPNNILHYLVIDCIPCVVNQRSRSRKTGVCINLVPRLLPSHAPKLRKDPGWGWSRDTPESGVFSISILKTLREEWQGNYCRCCQM